MCPLVLKMGNQRQELETNYFTYGQVLGFLWDPANKEGIKLYCSGVFC